MIGKRENVDTESAVTAMSLESPKLMSGFMSTLSSQGQLIDERFFVSLLGGYIEILKPMVTVGRRVDKGL
ncbi:hypothetical protein GCM10028805_58050 [Spirosoma harenae]